MPFCRSLLVLLAVAAFGWADAEVRTLGNQTLKGKVVSLKDQEVQVQDSSGTIKKTPLSQVLSITLRQAKEPPADAKYVLVQMVDDSRLYCTTTAFKGNELHVTLLSGQKATLPVASLTGFLRNAQDRNLREQYEKNLAKAGKHDRVLVLKGGQLNPLEGALGDVDPDGQRIQFRLDSGQVFTPKLDNVQGLIWSRPKGGGKAPVCLVIDTVGNTLAAANVTLQGDTFVVTTATGARIDFSEAALAKLDYNRGKLTFLSDMVPTDVVETSRIGLIVRYHKDKNLDDQPIYLGKVEHAKGLSMHAHTELEYDLSGKYKEFKAVFGADPRIGTETKAIVSIRCDGAQVFKGQVDIDHPQPIDIDVRNVQKLRVIVSSSNPLDLHDHATLADARVSQ